HPCMGFSFLLGYVSMNLGESAKSSIRNMSFYNEVTSSHSLATTGANVGLARFYQDTTWRGPMTQDLAGTPMNGSFRVDVSPAAGGALRLRSVSTFPISASERLHDTIEVYFDRNRKNSFTMYAWMSNFEGNVFWVTGDTLWGRVHSNGRIHINGSPVFVEKVTTAKGFDPKPGTGTNNAIYRNGYETGVAEIDFPSDLSEIIAASVPPDGRNYPVDIWVTLSPGTGANNDGWAFVKNAPAGPIVDSVNLNDPLFNGVILGSGRVNVQGTLDGKLSIASLGDVYIQDDVVYEQNPQTGPSDDLLGLIAEDNVVVADNAANNSNCIIHASIFTRTGSFFAENLNTRPVAGELYVLGSIVQEERGEVVKMNAGGITHGFSKRYRYDDRLADPAVRPPYYPGFYVKTYAIRNWWESYHSLETL
ncbi:MAG: hypothetical protein OEM41_01360, partial [Ignavibacteria bacterium]|nr:hypothetical protein [Ignavibacteria bacterium]